MKQQLQQQQQHHHLPKKSNEIYNLNLNSSDLYNIIYNSLSPNQLQNISISSFQQNFMNNDYNFKKLLYLLQFQVNPSIIISARGISVILVIIIKIIGLLNIFLCT